MPSVVSRPLPLKKSVAKVPVHARSFAFLQGVCSPFFDRLGAHLREAGASLCKVNFNAGDEAFWSRKSEYVAYQGDCTRLRPFYEELYGEHGVTDVVLFGDSRPVHRVAIEVAREQGRRVHVFEEGYFRPYWLTLERDGVNANSLLPRDPDWYREAGKLVPRYGNGQAFRSSFAARAWHDVLYHAHGLRNRWAYPTYQHHAPHSAWAEYAGYVKRAVKLRNRKRREAQQINRLVRQDSRFYLLALQLNSDVQIRQHSEFGDMAGVIRRVMPSFAQHAPDDALLVIKNHPLDPGLDDHEGLVLALARELGIQDRVIFFESGHLPTLLSHASGVVIVNSTVGGSALVHARPTIALGNAFYGLPGLTFQGSLDAFWRDAEPPDMRLFGRFRNTVIHTTQVNGGFYTGAGIRMGAEQAVSRLVAEYSPLEALMRQVGEPDSARLQAARHRNVQQ
ncbi:capsule biosynthesis protein [Bordetella sp. 2513F-2]